jgi:hypothetical protein
MAHEITRKPASALMPEAMNEFSLYQNRVAQNTPLTRIGRFHEGLQVF